MNLLNGCVWMPVIFWVGHNGTQNWLISLWYWRRQLTVGHCRSDITAWSLPTAMLSPNLRMIKRIPRNLWKEQQDVNQDFKARVRMETGMLVSRQVAGVPLTEWVHTLYFHMAKARIHSKSTAWKVMFHSHKQYLKLVKMIIWHPAFKK